MDALIVNYERPAETIKAIRSIQDCVDEIYVVENSHDINAEIYNMANVIKTPHNVGHGVGLDKGIRIICDNHKKINNTDNRLLIMDNDAELIDEDLFIKQFYFFSNNLLCAIKWYAVGKISLVDSRGRDNKNGIPYVHPFFMILNLNEYFNYRPFQHHGAPLINAMLDIDERGDGGMLIHYDWRVCVRHNFDHKKRPPEFAKNWTPAYREVL